MTELHEWVGRERIEEDVITLATARGMVALLDRDPDAVGEGWPLPECWHWLYFKPLAPRSELGEEGHARRGGFLPPVPLRRRMWAGGRLRFLRPLAVGDRVTRRSRILSVTEKEGRTGRLVFVIVGHVVDGPAGPAVEEEQDLVYREAPRPGEPLPEGEDPPGEATWAEPFLPDAVTLFRFSALTFNAHRIHYDHPYATQVEGYPALLVHGPLIALLMLDAAKRHRGRPPAAFAYRGVAPLFNDEPFTLCGLPAGDGEQAEVWAAGRSGRVAMRGTVDWAR